MYMICPKCNSDMNVQLVNKTKLVTKHKGIFWWIFIGFWWIPIKWIFFTLPALVLALFRGKKKGIKNIQQKYYVCNNCGYSKKA